MNKIYVFEYRPVSTVTCKTRGHTSESFIGDTLVFGPGVNLKASRSFNARRVVKFNPLDKSLTEIGTDLGDSHGKWRCGVRANTGSIYCAPYHAESILKIDTIDGTVETLDNVRLPETGEWLWESGALAADTNMIYTTCLLELVGS